MDVLHVTQPAVDGVARVVIELAKHQAKAGLKVAVAFPHGFGLIENSLVDTGVGMAPWAAVRSPLEGVASESADLLKIVRSLKPTVMHLHSAKAGMIGRMIPSTGTRVMYQPHAWSFWAATGRTREAAIMWERAAAKKADRTVFVCDDEELAGRRLGISPRHSVVIPNGVDTEKYKPGNQSKARSELALPVNGKIVVCVGRICRQKGQDLLLNEWRRVLRETPDAQLVFVGDGEDKDELMARGDNNVHWRPSSDPVLYYQAADLVVVPSRWEVIGLVTMEAMACGKPVLASRFPGVGYALNYEPLISDINIPGVFSDSILSWLSRPAAREEISPFLRERAVFRHSLEYAMRAHDSNLYELLDAADREGLVR